MDDLKGWMDKLTAGAWFIDATDEAVKLGTAILGNVIAGGCPGGCRRSSVGREHFREVMARTMLPDKVEMNLKAFDMGLAMIR